MSSCAIWSMQSDQGLSGRLLAPTPFSPSVIWLNPAIAVVSAEQDPAIASISSWKPSVCDSGLPIPHHRISRADQPENRPICYTLCLCLEVERSG